MANVVGTYIDYMSHRFSHAGASGHGRDDADDDADYMQPLGAFLPTVLPGVQLSVRKVRGKGLGAIAIHPIAKGDNIRHYCGYLVHRANIISRAGVDDPRKWACYIGDMDIYGYTLYEVDMDPGRPFVGRGNALDPMFDVPGNEALFVNEPGPDQLVNSLLTDVSMQCDGVRFAAPTLTATRRIPRGEEIVTHYGASYDRSSYIDNVA